MTTPFVSPDPSTLNTSGAPALSSAPTQNIVSPSSISRMPAPSYGMTNTGLDAITGGAIGGLLGLIIDRNKQAATGTGVLPGAGTPTGTQQSPASQIKPITTKPPTAAGGGGGGATTGTPSGTPIGGGSTGTVAGVAFPPGTTQAQVDAQMGTTNGQSNYLIAGVNTTNGTIVAQPNLDIGGANLTTSGGQGTPSTGSAQTGGLGGMNNNYSFSTITTGYGTDPAGNIYQYNADGSTTLVYTALGNGMYIYEGPSTSTVTSGSVLNEFGQQVFPNYGSSVAPIDTTITTPTVDVGAAPWDYANNALYYPTDPFAGYTPPDPTTVWTPIDTTGAPVFKKGGLATPMFKNGGEVKHFVGGGTTTDPTAVVDPAVVAVDPATGNPLTTMLNAVATPNTTANSNTGFINQVLANQMPSALADAGTAGNIVSTLANSATGGSSPGGTLNSLTSLLNNSGVQGTLIGALLGQLLSSSGTASVNQGVNMAQVGNIPGRTTTFGMGPTKFTSYDQYGTPTGQTNAYDQLLSNLGVSQTNRAPMPTMFTAPDRSIPVPTTAPVGINLPTSAQYQAGSNLNPAVNIPPHVIPHVIVPPTTVVEPVAPQAPITPPVTPTGGLNQTTTPTTPITPPIDIVPGPTSIPNETINPNAGGLGQTTTPTTPTTPDQTNYTYGTPVDPNTVLNPPTTPTTTDTTGGLGQTTTPDVVPVIPPTDTTGGLGQTTTTEPTTSPATPPGGETPTTPGLGNVGHEGHESEEHERGETAEQEAAEHPTTGTPPTETEEGMYKGLSLDDHPKLNAMNERLENLQDKLDSTTNPRKKDRISDAISDLQERMDSYVEKINAGEQKGIDNEDLAEGRKKVKEREDNETSDQEAAEYAARLAAMQAKRAAREANQTSPAGGLPTAPMTHKEKVRAYGLGPEKPEHEEPHGRKHMATGGLSAPQLVQGRHDFRAGAAVNGAGDGQSDDIPAMLADGEYVIDSEVVSMLGNGSNKAGAKKLDEFRQAIRSHKRSTPLHKIPPPAKSPLAYLKGTK